MEVVKSIINVVEAATRTIIAGEATVANINATTTIRMRVRIRTRLMTQQVNSVALITREAAIKAINVTITKAAPT